MSLALTALHWGLQIHQNIHDRRFERGTSWRTKVRRNMTRLEDPNRRSERNLFTVDVTRAACYYGVAKYERPFIVLNNSFVDVTAGTRQTEAI